MNTSADVVSSRRLHHFVIYVSIVLTLLMLMFPPFSSLNGTERAFVLTGPGWSQSLDGLAGQLGISVRLDWATLIGQLAALWAISLGAVWFLGRHSSGKRSRAAFATLTILLLACIAPASFAQIAEQEGSVSAVDEDATVGLQGGKFGVGFASSWPSYGLSGTYQMSETLTAEAVVGFFGSIRSFGARGWYRFNRNTNYDLYGYGTINLYQYDYTTVNAAFRVVDETESVLGLGGGAGIEAGIQTLFKDRTLPPIFLNWEVGIAIASFDYYNFSSFVFGGGLHYRFGAR